MKKTHMLILLLIAVVLILFFIFLFDIFFKNNNNDWQYLRSNQFKNSSLRVSKLKSVINLPSEIYDAEFVLFNVNGFEDTREVPGASSWEYMYAVKLKRIDIDKWTIGYKKEEDEGININWIRKRLSLGENFELKSEPEIYEKSYKESIIVFRNDSIVVVNNINK
jgi:hypothetical protein